MENFNVSFENKIVEEEKVAKALLVGALKICTKKYMPVSALEDLHEMGFGLLNVHAKTRVISNHILNFMSKCSRSFFNVPTNSQYSLISEISID